MAKFLRERNIKQIYISDAINHVGEKIKFDFDLHDYISLSIPTIFFGVYTKDDLIAIRRHISDVYIIFEGHDIDLIRQNKLIDSIKNLPNLKTIIALTKTIQNSLQELDMESKLVNLNIVNPEKKLITEYGENIFIYNGYNKNTEHIYCKSFYDDLTKKLQQNYNIVFSNTLNYPIDMMKIYKKCFIGISIVNDENILMEMLSYGLPVINNEEDKCIRWRNINDIYNIVNKIHETIKFKITKSSSVNLSVSSDLNLEKNNSMVKLCSDDSLDSCENKHLTTDLCNSMGASLNIISESFNSNMSPTGIIKSNDEITTKINKSVELITQDILNQIIQKITQTVVENITKKIKTPNYKNEICANVELELQKINFI